VECMGTAIESAEHSCDDWHERLVVVSIMSALILWVPSRFETVLTIDQNSVISDQ